MYESYFKLRVKPFELVPDPHFIFLSKSHKKALSFLAYGIQERSGFILLTGEVGSGKTTLIRDIYNKHYDRVVLAKIFNTCVTSEQLFAMINDDFGLPVQGKDKVTLIRDLNSFLVEQYACGNQPILIIDEAQNLGAELLEEIRMLSNLETDDSKLLQIILVGQPELRTILAAPQLMQLRQRININCHIQALNREETAQYILHRLDVAGNADAAEFPVETLDYIYRYSKGIPRLINIICDFLMLSAFAEETCTISIDMVREVIGDLDFENYYWSGAVAEIDHSHQVGSASASAGDAQISFFQEVRAVLQDIARRIESIETDVAPIKLMLNAHSDKLDELQDRVTYPEGKVDVQDATSNARDDKTLSTGRAVSARVTTNDPAYKRFTQWMRTNSSGE
jgi:general secretion pathway protein A